MRPLRDLQKLSRNSESARSRQDRAAHHDGGNRAAWDRFGLIARLYELGVRSIGLTHARSNAAGHGGVFGASGSSSEGLTSFGQDVVRECERLAVIIDLAHINPAGFDEILSITTQPPIVSHTNVRRYYDIERNISDRQIEMIGERGGV